MSATLRDAAQAFVDLVDWDLAELSTAELELLDSLRAALATPDTDRWAEGAEAMRRDVIVALDKVAAGERPEAVANIRTVLALACADVNALPLPVPPATTAPEAGTYEWQDSTGKRTTVRASESQSIPVTLAVAPEAPCGCNACAAGREVRGAVDPSACEAKTAEPVSPAYTLPSPEAKTAESEVGWTLRRGSEPLIDAINAACLYSDRDAAAEDCECTDDPADRVVRLRVTVEPEPSPVEPEETQR